MSYRIPQHGVVDAVGASYRLESGSHAVRLADEHQGVVVIERCEVRDVPIEHQQATAREPRVIVQAQRRAAQARDWLQ